MKEKFGITDYLPNGGKVFVNGDDDLLSTLKAPRKSRSCASVSVKTATGAP